MFYRINVINIELPPLRKRENDIIYLSNHFLSKFSDKSKQLDDAALSYIKQYDWPGNVRELENLFKRVSVLSTERVVSLDTIENLIDNQPKTNTFKDEENIEKQTGFSNFFNNFLENFFKTIEDENIDLNLYEKFLNEIEKPLIYQTLKYFNGNQIKTAKILGINRNTLRAKIDKHNIQKK